MASENIYRLASDIDAVAAEEITTARLNAVVRKASWRLVPWVALLYLVSFLDRVNIGFAALTMNADLGLSAQEFGIGAGVFFVGYLLFTVPGNLMLRRIGASRWMAIIMTVWGAISVGMAFVSTPLQFYILRFALGAAESGFLPGVMLYLTFWFPEDVRGRIIGRFFAAVPLSNVVGAPVSTWLLDHHLFGLRGWQSMFVVEGIPAVLLGLLTYLVLTDEPARARWLDDSERHVLSASIQDAGRGKPSSVKAGLANPTVWLIGMIYFLLVIGLYGFAFFAPQMFRDIGHLANDRVGWMVAIPYAVAAASMFPWSKRSDILRERRWHLAAPAFLGAAGFVLAAVSWSLPVLLIAFCLGSIGIYVACPILWTLPAAALNGAAAAAGIALVNSIGNVAGFVGPAGMGWLRDRTGGYSVGLGVLAISMAAAGMLALTVKEPRAGVSEQGL